MPPELIPARWDDHEWLRQLGLPRTRAQPPAYANLRDRHRANHCPICDVPLTSPGLTWPRPHTPTTRTKAHVISIARQRDLWVYACQRCNSDQGSLTMPEWAVIMLLREDPRLPRLVKLLETVLCR